MMDKNPQPEEIITPPPAAAIMADPVVPREDVVAAQDVKPEKKPNDPTSRLGQYAVTGGPGRKKGGKNQETILKDAEIQFCLDTMKAWSKSGRVGKKWFENYVKRHPVDAMEKIISIIGKTSKKDSAGDTHLHFNLAELVSRVNKKQDAEKNG